MHALIWSPLALDRLYEIAAYIAEDKPSAALNWVESLFVAAERLQTFPLSGRVVPELYGSAYRELLHDGYRVIYQLKDEQVQIITVRHSRRLLDEAELG